MVTKLETKTDGKPYSAHNLVLLKKKKLEETKPICNACICVEK